MDIWTVLKACARRWYVFLPILGAALWIGNARVEAMPPVYYAESSAALTGPALVPGDTPGEIIEVNPFQTMGGSLNTTTQIMVTVMDSIPKREAFFDEGVTLDYEVSRDDAVIYFYVEGDDPTSVAETSARLVELLDVEVATLQSKPVEAPESRIRAVPLALPLVAERDTGAGLQLLAVIGILGLLGAAGAAVVVDGIARQRARRAEARRAEAVAATAWADLPATTGPRAVTPEIRRGAPGHAGAHPDAPAGAVVEAPADAVATQQLALHDRTDLSDQSDRPDRTDLGEPEDSAPVPAPAGRHGRPD